MKYLVSLERTETKEVEVFGPSFAEAAKRAEQDGFRAVDVTELVDEDKQGVTRYIDGHCEGCSTPLFEGECVLCEDEVMLCRDCAQGIEQEGDAPNQ